VQKEIAGLKRRAIEINARIAKLEEAEAKRQCLNDPIKEALCLLQSEYLPLDQLLQQEYPDLIHNRDFWWAFLEIKDTMAPLPEVWRLLESQEPTSILEDKDLMVELCSYDCNIYCLIPDGSPLQNDELLVETVLNSAPMYGLRLPARVQEEHPVLVGAALARLPLSTKKLQDRILPGMNASLWQHRAIVKGWAHGGGTYHENIPPSILEDSEIALLLQGNHMNVEPANSPLPELKRKDKDYMMKAVENNPMSLHQVAASLVGDFDLIVAALSVVHCVNLLFNLPEHWLPGGGLSLGHRTDAFIRGIAGTIREKLHTHDVFVKWVLVASSAGGDSASSFAVLNQGKATSSEAYMKPIAEFLGIAMGSELRRLRGARKNLALFGYQWSDPQC